jgi:inner membrane protein YhjD
MTVLAISMAKVAATAGPDAHLPGSAGPRQTDASVPKTTKSGILGRVDLYQQEREPLAFGVGVIKKFGDDRAGRLAALIAYYGFFSVFPAMLALVTVLGFVLQGNAKLRTSIANSALGQFPIVGSQIKDSVSHPLTGSTIALVIGLLGAVWAGLGAMQAAQDSINEVWDVPRTEYPNFIRKRLRSIAMLLLIVVGLAISSAVAQLAVNVVSGVVATVALFLLSIVSNVAMYLIAFHLLTVADMTWRRVFPGAMVAGVGYTLLQAFGTIYVTHTLKGAQNTYGTFAMVIGLLSWIYLIAQLTMFAAEVNVVTARRLWPRSLFSDAATPADERSAALVVEAAEIDTDEVVDVEFSDTAPAPPLAPVTTR